MVESLNQRIVLVLDGSIKHSNEAIISAAEQYLMIRRMILQSSNVIVILRALPPHPVLSYVPTALDISR